MYRTIRQTLLFALIALVAVHSAPAATITWQGTGTNSNWSTTGNWSTTPTNSGTFSLVFQGSNRTTNSDNIGAAGSTITVDSILFANDNTGSGTSSFSVSSANSRTLTLTNGATITTTAVSAGSLTDQFSIPIVTSGTINFNLGAGHGVNFIPSAYTGSPTIVKTGAGTLQLGQTNARTYAGLSVNQGSVFLNTTAAVAGLTSKTVQMGTGVSSGSLVFNTANSSSTTDMNFALNSSGTVSANGGAKMVFSNAQFNAPTSTASAVTLTLTGGKETQVIQGAIVNNVGAVSLNVAGSNTWVLQGANTYSGNTTIGSSAAVLLDGQLAAGNVTTNGYLGGSGTTAGLVTVSGTLSPGGTSTSGGAITDSIATLTVGSLTLNSTATTLMTVSGSTAGLFDQIAGTSGLSYGGTLALTLSGSYADYTAFNLFSGFSSRSGNFSSITLSAVGSPYDGLTFSGPNGSGDWYTGWTAGSQQLKFSQSTGTLSVVPEPSTIVFAGIGMAMCGWRTWKRRRATARRLAAEAVVG